jgi:spermidine synthase
MSNIDERDRQMVGAARTERGIERGGYYHGPDRDAPRVRLLVEDAVEFLAEGLAVRDHLG